MSANPDPNVNVNLNPNPQVQNIFKLPDPLNTAAEIFEPLVPPNSSPSSISSVPLIERIISTGQVTTPADYWYDSDKEEFVVVLQGSAQLKYDDENGPVVSLQAGDYVTIPAHKKHRVVFTSEDPPCVWLAVHYPR